MEVELQILELVKEKHKRTGGNNGISLFELASKISNEDLLKSTVNKLLSEKKIVKINHLNGTSYTLPK